MKLKILIAVYNDWSSLDVLLGEIKNNLQSTIWKDYEVYIVNDASTIEAPKEIKKKTKIINLFNNIGSQGALSIGVKYIEKNDEDLTHLLILDSDGEDRPQDILRLLDKCKEDENKIVFAKRKKRKESFLFRMMHLIYKKLFKILIGKELDFGNFSCMAKANLKKIVNINNLQNHYSASILRSKIPYKKIDCDKGSRIEGSSKLNFWKHFAHALMSLSVFIDLIAIKFLFISLIGIVLSIIFAVIIFLMKFYYSQMLLGLTSNILLSLAIILIVLFLICLFSLIIFLNNKNQSYSSSNKSIDHLIDRVDDFTD
jgi:polyisoprenyl-phosphate glycosyltransferase